MSQKRVLTGITTTGIPHLGNYVGAIRPAIAESRASGEESFLFLADYHGIIKCHDPEQIHRSTLAVAATWLACGLDPETITFYRQSDIPEVPELTWIFNCVCAKGLMNRAHAYKASVDANLAEGNTDPDHGISMGLFSYPVLMAADILIFNATHIPVGRDQIQHVEMARDIAGRFNPRYRELFVLPEAVVDDEIALLTGLDALAVGVAAWRLGAGRARRARPGERLRFGAAGLPPGGRHDHGHRPCRRRFRAGEPTARSAPAARPRHDQRLGHDRSSSR